MVTTLFIILFLSTLYFLYFCITHPDFRPDKIINRDGDSPESPYLRRWYLIPRNLYFNVYLHHFQRSDIENVFHDHSWWSLAFLLKGSYIEHLPLGNRLLSAPNWIWRPRPWPHWVELTGKSAWTLFITGPKRAEWGFICGDRWVHNKEYDEKGCN